MKRKPGNYGDVDLATGEVRYYRVDTLGRSRRIEGQAEHPLLPPGVHRRYPQATYTFGYAYAVSDELQALLWPTIIAAFGSDEAIPGLVDGLTLPSPPARDFRYTTFVTYYQGVASLRGGMPADLPERLAKAHAQAVQTQKRPAAPVKATGQEAGENGTEPHS